MSTTRWRQVDGMSAALRKGGNVCVLSDSGVVEMSQRLSKEVETVRRDRDLGGRGAFSKGGAIARGDFINSGQFQFQYRKNPNKNCDKAKHSGRRPSVD